MVVVLTLTRVLGFCVISSHSFFMRRVWMIGARFRPLVVLAVSLHTSLMRLVFAAELGIGYVLAVVSR